MSLYIIFLGIVPTIGLISFGIWYTRNNGGAVKHWKKASSSGAMSTYVCSVDCFKSRRSKASSIPKLPKKSLVERVFADKAKSASVEPSSGKVFTISERIGTLPRDKIRIVKRDLVSTTNPEAISCSSEIEYRRSIAAADEEATAAATATSPAVVAVTKDARDSRDPAKRASPLKTELGIKLAEHIQQLQRGHMQPKNFKGLTLKTDLKFEQLRESPSSSSNVTPQIAAGSGETLLPRQQQLAAVSSKAPAFYDKKPPPPPVAFYDKKPPPPPAPPQSAKPKF